MTDNTRERQERAEQVLAKFTVSIHEANNVHTVSFNYDEMRDLITAALAEAERAGMERAAMLVEQWHISKGGYSEMAWQIRTQAQAGEVG